MVNEYKVFRIVGELLSVVVEARDSDQAIDEAVKIPLDQWEVIEVQTAHPHRVHLLDLT